MVGLFERRAGYLRVEACVEAHLKEATKLGATLRGQEPVVSWRADGSGFVVQPGPDGYSADRRGVARRGTRASDRGTVNAEWDARVREVVRGLIDDGERKGSFDVVHDLAAPLPVIMIAEVIGVPSDRFREFKKWSDAAAAFIGRLDPSVQERFAYQNAERLIQAGQ